MVEQQDSATPSHFVGDVRVLKQFEDVICYCHWLSSHVLLACSTDGKIYSVVTSSIETTPIIRRLATVEDNILTAAFSPDRSLLALSTELGIHLFNVNKEPSSSIVVLTPIPLPAAIKACYLNGYGKSDDAKDANRSSETVGRGIGFSTTSTPEGSSCIGGLRGASLPVSPSSINHTTMSISSLTIDTLGKYLVVADDFVKAAVVQTSSVSPPSAEALISGSGTSTSLPACDGCEGGGDKATVSIEMNTSSSVLSSNTTSTAIAANDASSNCTEVMDDPNSTSVSGIRLNQLNLGKEETALTMSTFLPPLDFLARHDPGKGFSSTLPRNSHLQPVTRECTLKGYDIESGKKVFEFPFGTQKITSIEWKAAILTCGTEDGVVYVWDTSSKTKFSLIFRWNAHQARVQALSMSNAGTLLASCSYDKTAAIFALKPFVNSSDVKSKSDHIQLDHNRGSETTTMMPREESPQLVRRLPCSSDWVTALAWNPTDTLLAVGSFDRTLSVWHIESGELVRSYVGHQGGITSVDWNPSGAMIASAACDFSMRLWAVDVETGCTSSTLGMTASQIFDGHDDGVR